MACGAAKARSSQVKEAQLLKIMIVLRLSAAAEKLNRTTTTKNSTLNALDHGVEFPYCIRLNTRLLGEQR